MITIANDIPLESLADGLEGGTGKKPKSNANSMLSGLFGENEEVELPKKANVVKSKIKEIFKNSKSKVAYKAFSIVTSYLVYLEGKVNNYILSHESIHDKIKMDIDFLRNAFGSLKNEFHQFREDYETRDELFASYISKNKKDMDQLMGRVDSLEEKYHKLEDKLNVSSADVAQDNLENKIEEIPLSVGKFKFIDSNHREVKKIQFNTPYTVAINLEEPFDGKVKVRFLFEVGKDKYIEEVETRSKYGKIRCNNGFIYPAGSKYLKMEVFELK